jgi:hypothetical protein
MTMSQERFEGTAQESTGAIREGWGRLKDSVGEAVYKIRQDPAMERSDTRRAALKLLAYIAAALVVLNALVHAPRRR